LKRAADNSGYQADSRQAFDIQSALPFSCTALVELVQLQSISEATGFEEPISLESLEMIEAELLNQGLLPDLGSEAHFLSKQASLEASYWLWRTRRHGVRDSEILFQVDLRAYLLRLVVEYTESFAFKTRRSSPAIRQFTPWTVDESDSMEALEKLRYLNAFASILMSRHKPRAENRYQRGLDLLLELLAKSAKPSGVKKLCLPLSRRDFLSFLDAERVKK